MVIINEQTLMEKLFIVTKTNELREKQVRVYVDSTDKHKKRIKTERKYIAAHIKRRNNNKHAQYTNNTRR